MTRWFAGHGATRSAVWPDRVSESATKPLASNSSTTSVRSCTVAGGTRQRGADRLLDLHEPLVDQAQVGVRVDIRTQRLPDAGRDLAPFSAGGVDALVSADERGVPQGADHEEAYAEPFFTPMLTPARSTSAGVVRSEPCGTAYTPSMTTYGAVKATSVARAGSTTPVNAVGIVRGRSHLGVGPEVHFAPDYPAKSVTSPGHQP